MGDTTPTKKIEDKLKNTDPMLLEIIKKMLSFSPEKRISAKESLEHEYFKDIRNP